MLWSKEGWPVLREVNYSGFLFGFVGGKVHKVVCGDCWHL